LTPRPRLRHLALAVRDQARSRRFYETYFGFDGSTAQRYPDGTLILRHAEDGFSLALGRLDSELTLPPFLHFGFDFGRPEEVRRIRDRLRADGVEIVEEWEEDLYVSCKCRDPDGYVVEAAWELPQPNE
jgi:catechol 2,3-dioxygenase-like lactoylglutathione lyase family enzyme